MLDVMEDMPFRGIKIWRNFFGPDDDRDYISSTVIIPSCFQLWTPHQTSQLFLVLAPPPGNITKTTATTEMKRTKTTPTVITGLLNTAIHFIELFIDMGVQILSIFCSVPVFGKKLQKTRTLLLYFDLSI